MFCVIRPVIHIPVSYTHLSSAWIEAMSKGQQPSAPEDYIEVEQ